MIFNPDEREIDECEDTEPNASEMEALGIRFLPSQDILDDSFVF